MLKKNKVFWRTAGVLAPVMLLLFLGGWLLPAAAEAAVMAAAPSGAAAPLSEAAPPAAPATSPQVAAPPQEAATLPLVFEPTGGASANWQFTAESGGNVLLFGETGIEFWLLNAPKGVGAHYVGAQPLRWQGAIPQGRAHVYAGNDPAAWHEDLPLYAELRAAELYPGITAVYNSVDGQLKSEYHLAAGANPAQIRLRYDGATRLWLDNAGHLHIETPYGNLTEAAPLAWQIVDGARQDVRVQFALDGNTLAFALGEYNPALPLTIDPVMTYLKLTEITHIATDDDGNVYIGDGGGYTVVNNYGYPLITRGGTIRISKLSPNGEMLYRVTLKGGTKTEYASTRSLLDDVWVDDAGRVFFSGRTNSPDFPITSNAAQPSCGGDGLCGRQPSGIIGDPFFYYDDALLGQLNAEGKVAYATFWGGPQREYDTELALDAEGFVYLAGYLQTPCYQTSCTYEMYGFPTMPLTVTGAVNANQYVPYNELTAFLAKFDLDKVSEPPTPGALGSPEVVYSTLLWLVDGYDMTDLAADSQGRAWIASDEYLQPILADATDYGQGFWVPTPAAISRVWMTDADKLYVVGTTGASGAATLNAPDTSLGGTYDAFLARFALDGTKEFYTYIGGNVGGDGNQGIEYGRALWLRGDKVVVAGSSESNDFALVNGIGSAPTDNHSDLFVTVYTIQSNQNLELNWQTLLGGYEDDRLFGVVLDANNDVWLAGEAYSQNFSPDGQLRFFPFGYPRTPGRFLAKILGIDGLNLHVSQVVERTTVPLNEYVVYEVTAANYGNKDAVNVVVSGTLPAKSYVVFTEISFPLECTHNDPANTYQCTFPSLSKGQAYNLRFKGLTQQYGVVTHTVQIDGQAADGSSDVYEDDDEAVSRVYIRTGLGIANAGVSEHTSGEPLTYTLVITNYGPDPMEDVIFSQTLRGEGAFLGSPIPKNPSSNDPPCVLQGTPLQNLTCAFPNPIPSGQTIEFDVPVTTVITASGNLTFSVALLDGKSTVTNQPDVDTSDNEHVIFTALKPPGANLAVQLLPMTEIYTAGYPLTFTVFITNYGGEVAKDVTVTTTLGTEAVTFLAVPTGGGSLQVVPLDQTGVQAAPLPCTFSQPQDQPARYACRFGERLMYPNEVFTYKFKVIPLDVSSAISELTGQGALVATAFVTGTAVTVDSNGQATATNNGDPLMANNTHARSFTVGGGYNLSVSMDSVSALPYNEPYTLTFRADNRAGFETATEVTFTLTVPVSLTYNLATTNDGACQYDPSPLVRKITCTTPWLEAGTNSTDEWIVYVNVTANQTGTVSLGAFWEAADSYSEYLNDTTRNGGFDTLNDNVITDLSITRDSQLQWLITYIPADARVGTGNTITFTVRLKNNGPNTAINPYFTFNAAPYLLIPTGYPIDDCFTGAQGFQCLLPNLKRGQTSAPLTLVATAAAQLDNSPTPVVVTWRATSQHTKNPAQTTTTIRLFRKTDLTVSVESLRGSPLPISKPYTLTVSADNNGPFASSATTVTLQAIGYSLNTATLLAKPTFCNLDTSGSLVCVLGALNADDPPRTFDLQLMAPDQSGTRMLGATISSVNLLPTGQSTTIHRVEFRPERDVRISISDSPDPAQPGARLNLNVTLHNQSAESATQLKLLFYGNYPLRGVRLPDGVTCRAVAPPLGYPNAYQCSLPDLSGNTQATYNFSVIVPQGKKSLTHYAKFEMYEINQHYTSSELTVTTIEQRVDLQVTKFTDSPDPVSRGKPITYAAEIYNSSAISATNVTALFANPDLANVQGNAGSGIVCTVSGATVSCAYPHLLPYERKTLQFSGTVPQDTTKTEVSASILLSSAETDSDTANNGKIAQTLVQDQIDLSAAWGAPGLVGTPAAAGDLVRVRLVVFNTGPETAEDVKGSFTLSANLELVGIKPGASQIQCTQSQCSFGNLTANNGQDVEFTVRVLPPVNPGDTAYIQWQVQAQNSHLEGNPADDQMQADIPLSTEADLSVGRIVSANGKPLTPGTKTNAVSLTLKNAGPATAKNVQVSITSSAARFESVSDPNCNASGSTLTCTFASLPKGERVIPFTVFIPSDADESTPLPFDYSITATSNDPNPGNNNSQASLSVMPQYDLQVRSSNLPADFSVGDSATLQFSVINNGPSDVKQPYQINLDLPVGLNTIRFVSSSDNRCNITQNNVLCIFDTPLPTGSAPQTFEVTLRGEKVGTETLRMYPTQSQYQPTVTPHQIWVEVKEGEADLAVKNGTFTTAPNQTVPIQASIFNFGPQSVNNAQVVITVPSNMVLAPNYLSTAIVGGLNIGFNCNISGQQIVCDVSDFTASSSLAVNFYVVPRGWFTSVYNIQVQVSSNSGASDPNLYNNQSVLQVIVRAP